MAYGDFKNSARRTASDKVLRDEAFNIAKNPKYDGYYRGLASMVYKFLYRYYIDKLDIVNAYNNTYHRAIKMKPVDVKDNTYIDSNTEVNDKDPKFKVGDHVRFSTYKNIFANGYTPYWSEEVFVIKKS